MSGGARVSIATAAGGYPAAAPFDPGEAYPEFASRPHGAPNAAFAALRAALAGLDLDRERFGTADWNPLGGIVRPGDRVFVKPNLVGHEHRGHRGTAEHLFSVITHASVVRAVTDYVALALGGRGEILIGDNPSIDADFDRILAATGLAEVAAVYPARFGVPCRVLDLRPLRTVDLADYGYRSRTVEQPGDPDGVRVLDLGSHSHFEGLDARRFRGVFTDRRETIAHHSGGRHEYALSASIVDADVFVSVPKLKAHHKVGATLNVKGLVGTAALKNYLVHWRIGFPGDGGDEYPRAWRRLDPARLAVRHFARDVLPEGLHRALARRLRGTALARAFEPRHADEHERYRGAWDGNDTCWRMAADLYDVFVRDRAGYRAGRARPMRFFSVVDGIEAGEGNGPFAPRPRDARVVVAGDHLLAVDTVAARLMDYDIGNIRYLGALLAGEGLRPGDIDVRATAFDTRDFFGGGPRFLRFEPPQGWPRLALTAPGGEATRCD